MKANPFLHLASLAARAADASGEGKGRFENCTVCHSAAIADFFTAGPVASIDTAKTKAARSPSQVLAPVIRGVVFRIDGRASPDLFHH